MSNPVGENRPLPKWATEAIRNEYRDALAIGLVINAAEFGARLVLDRLAATAEESEPLINFALHDELRDNPRKFEFYMMGRKAIAKEVSDDQT